MFRVSRTLAALSLIPLVISGCATAPVAEKADSAAGVATVSEGIYGTAPSGEQVLYYRVENGNGLQALFIGYGATLVSLKTPDASGKLADIVLGCDGLDAYVAHTAFFGAIAGRYANRIGGAKFSLNDQEYPLAANDPPNTLHGGNVGFNKVVWKGESFSNREGAGVVFTYLSKDMEEGFPGNLECIVTYTLNNDNELHIEYEAETDKATVVNLTHHSYFNLKGHNAGDVLDHRLWINADHYTPTDESLIPTGSIENVVNTPLDFLQPKPIGQDIAATDGGYDNNFVLNNRTGSLAHAATVAEASSGRIMEVYTTEPGLQLYTGNHLEGIAGKEGATYGRHAGFCLEAQHFPDSPNKPSFPSTVLRPGEQYHQVTVYRFIAAPEEK